jgi:signal peptidase I
MEGERSVWREYLEALIIAAVFLLFTNTFVVQTFYIPSGSMEDTLLIGDHLFVNRFIFGPTPTALEKSLTPGRPIHRGDIVIFRSPEDPRLDLVKRCVAVGGDTVQVINSQLYINGKAVHDASYAVHKNPDLGNGLFVDPRMRFRDNYGPYSVPAGHYFCMGDNRDNSYDSRFWGTVPAHLVKGRALFIYWSYGGKTSTGQWEGTGQKLRDLAETALGFFSKTRWERTFRLIR